MNLQDIVTIKVKIEGAHSAARRQIETETGCTEEEIEPLFQLARDFSHTTIYPLDMTCRHVIMAYRLTDFRGDDLTRFLQHIYRDAASINESPAFLIHACWAKND